jgi:microtubule-associated protein-like 6
MTTSGKKTLISEAHYAVRQDTGELWGLALHPSLPLAATGGDDGTVRVWELNTHKQRASVKLDTLVRAVAYSPDGSLIAAGLGGRLGGKEAGPEGQFVVLNASTLAIVHSGHDSKEWIQDVKFSPDGTKLAVSSHDNKIYVYDVTAGFSLKATCGAHNSFITHFDFSADSNFIQSNCGAYELLFHDAETGKQEPGGATKLRNTEWATWTCVLGWPVQYIWPAFADGTDINSVDRSPSGRFLALADDSGKVKLFNYPVVTPSAASKSFDGHSSHVTNVRFNPTETHLLSVGGNDRAVFQWVFRR